MATNDRRTLSQVAVLDTSVLFPLPLCDALLRAAQRQLYEVRWSEDILGELKRNLIRDRGLSQIQAQHRIDEMRRAFPEAVVDWLRGLAEAMTNHPSDRHVLAAAVAARADTIVTLNLRHFPATALDPSDTRALSPDEFLSELLEREPNATLKVLRNQAEALKSPPMDVRGILALLASFAPRFSPSVLARTDS